MYYVVYYMLYTMYCTIYYTVYYTVYQLYVILLYGLENFRKRLTHLLAHIRGRIDIEATLRLMVALTQKVYFF